jgi:hypothetical protein
VPASLLADVYEKYGTRLLEKGERFEPRIGDALVAEYLMHHIESGKIGQPARASHGPAGACGIDEAEIEGTRSLEDRGGACFDRSGEVSLRDRGLGIKHDRRAALGFRPCFCRYEHIGVVGVAIRFDWLERERTMPAQQRLNLALHMALEAHTGEEADPDAARIIFARSELLDGRLVAWVDLAVAPAAGEAIWISAGKAEEGTSSAVVIPQDLRYPVPVRLDITFDEKDHGWALSALSARLADPSNLTEHTTSAWQTLWEAQRIEAFADLASAGRTVEQMLDLQAVVDGKSESPLAAALAVNLLLRSNGLNYLNHWPRNLAMWFDWLADGPILWSETLLRRFELDPENREIGRTEAGYPEEALEYFLMTAERRAPLLSNSLVLAHR